MLAEAVLRHLAFAAGLAVLSALVVRLMIAWPILDHPNARSSHTRPTPRGGGLGVVLAFVVGMAALYVGAAYARLPPPQFLGVIGAAVAIAAVSLWDDVKDLRFSVKLAAQAGAALVAMAAGLTLDSLALPWIGEVPLGWIGLPLTLFWIVGCTNALNFMDGLDGLVGGSVFLAAVILCVVAAGQGGWFVYAAALLLAAGLAGFLPFNLHPARIFMGDVGSQFLGFMMAVLAVAAARFDAAQVSFLIVPLLLFGLLFDAAFTLLRRAAMGERIAAAHRTHLYQMAQRSGMTVRAVAALHWSFVLFHGALVALFLHLPSGWKPLVVLPALIVQCAWLLHVARRVRRAGLTWSAE
ncbi:undecaprenyl/decaprenyl-phosphate alpha-N-acetylglucosaminyl 1-phosphate transferase [Roseomonas alkaliterrae]|uniref:UDP-GlcNAc:undecaprenyl-phosphate GlcNAc-1-phosphate transferase n=1 Tax=Neoroseomonas alkaliterrae TaxID=1452450 RepID=A0A840XZD2_9PROT|nr:undecaprenyl/decaprenyl-phosphate alpha-N-acetylglucosaminyl 1-phosphate transferase [Neoroseomonas alkaliterrae]MBB5689527.1 UDP-GlcNAc:undecaprenyl-phosphate GlcNAc-1-phosphate transferase [Neoroseomonas alkaliterrae]MBR0678345.1 undecaprenyl/decaprenyl-phosphate alpha-N-acetylglucosaminyl 1-phosphate transferase [Neoroseomonas alkaliterrae]